MHLEGTHILNAPPDAVWKMLLDPDVLARVTPGISRLEPLGDDRFTAISEIKMGPVNGSFRGTMEVCDRVELQGYVLKIKMTGKIGNVDAEGKLEIKPLSGGKQTEVDFAGDAKLTGTLARTGQRVLSGVANTMTNQFFKALEKEIEEKFGPPPGAKPGLWVRLVSWLKRLFGKK